MQSFPVIRTMFIMVDTQLLNYFVYLGFLTQEWQAWPAGLGEQVCGARWNQSVHL